ncbi:hypothetical protein AYI68_g4393 [Smittium mucronatum]|uniref:Uncharacterized protein n=1 Tax=Smittium mucronatum TaxID=133383 RepID=A0A1R0GX70_9FUNG|nr:hypothetical protein AYI68_g4393 [Smittium mucronatum]
MPEDTEVKLKLSILLNNLLSKREPKIVEADHFLTTRAPETYLRVHTELIEGPPLIEDDLFRTLSMEEEQNNAIYACPKIISMEYQPPPLKDSESAVVMRADTNLHENQVSLAQTIRLFYY